MKAKTDLYAGFRREREALKKLRRAAARKKRLKAAAFAPIFKRYGIRAAYVFGSVAAGRCSPHSDIDLYVEAVEPVDYWPLWRDLEACADQPVDLYCQRDDPAFVSTIKERGELIYAG